jgi:hypothetical protein
MPPCHPCRRAPLAGALALRVALMLPAPAGSIPAVSPGSDPIRPDRGLGVRNCRGIGLSRRLRDRVGARYGLGAITPPWFYAWRPFPYSALARHYDVFMPMNYFTVRAQGAADARIHTRRNIRLLRRETENPDAAIHDIGGLAEDLEPNEVRTLVRTDRREGVLGTSLYDSFTTDSRGWRRLRSELRRRFAV